MQGSRSPLYSEPLLDEISSICLSSFSCYLIRMPPEPLRHQVATISETEALARRIAALAMPGDTIALHGEMGAGKSVFARAFIRARADDAALEVPSPSFALMHLYSLPSGDIAHYDLWRLENPEAVHELNWEADEPLIALVEWPEHAGAHLPSDALHVYFTEPATTGAADISAWHESAARDITIEGWPERRL